VPELEEEKFQSLLSVPVSGRDGDVIGAITMHTEAPREFTAKEVELLTSTASLVAGAIENARLYEETRRRVGELEHLTELAETLARAQQLGEVLPAVAERTRQLLRSRSCHVYLLDGGSEELRLKASAPADSEARATIRLSELGPELARSGRSASVAVPIVADDELLGLISAEGTTEVDLVRAAANQTAVAIKKIELIERLTEKNLIKDFFEQLAGGNVLGAVEGRATRLGCDLDRTYVVVEVAPHDEAVEKALRASTPGSLFDHRDDSSRALLRVPSTGEASLVERIEAVHAEVGSPVSIGISNPCKGAASFQAGFEEAGHALLGSVIRGTPGVMTYEELGPYKYLLRMSLDSTVRDSQRDLIAKIAEYDRQRQTSLLRTLEEFLRRRGNISATAEALYVHPNTLRQRLRRIQEISGLDLRKEDWLLIEIAVKMVKLQEALGGSEPT
jgi:sugar diacid utilization regulator